MPAHREFFENFQLQRTLAQKLNVKYQEHDISKLYGVNENINEVYSLIERTIKTGEGNSLILLGPVGSSKKTIVNAAIQRVKQNCCSRFLHVTLDGLLDTSFTEALRTMYIQLNLQNTGNKELEKILYQDDVDDEGDTNTNNESDVVMGSVREVFEEIFNSILSGNRDTSQPIVFVLKNLHCFTAQPRQNLLYNLYDWSQSQKVPICVIGLSHESDCISFFEKRVKSRFSKRVISTMCLNFENYYKVFGDLLLINDEKEWSQYCKNLISDPNMKSTIQRQYDVNPSLKGLKLLMLRAISTYYSQRTRKLNFEIFNESFLFQTDDPVKLCLRSLSALEYILLVSVVNCLDLNQLEKVTFEMVYQNYEEFSIKTKSAIRYYDRAICLKAFEKLETNELIRSTDAQKSLKEYREVKLLIDRYDVREAARFHPHCPIQIIQWAASENVF